MTAYNQRMTSIVPTLKAHDALSMIGQPVNDFSLAFIAPLGTDYNYVFCNFSLCHHSTYILKNPFTRIENECAIAVKFVLFVLVSWQTLNHNFAFATQCGDFFPQGRITAPGSADCVFSLGRRQQTRQFTQIQRKSGRGT